MNLRHLKKFRVVISLIIFAFILLLFLDISTPLIDTVSKFFLRLQLFPSLLRFFALFFTISGLGFIFIILLSLFFGRVYCSTLCPLGTLQDIIIVISRKFKSRKKKKFVYSRNSNRILRYGILGITILFWLFGSLFFVNLLDPYSNFGKIAVTFFQPLFFWINNTINIALEGFDIYALSTMEIKSVPFYVVTVSTIILLVVAGLSIWRGRLFCNTICPVGAALGLISEVSLYKIGFTKDFCNNCMKCEQVCKAQCLDSRNNFVDQSRCVSCFNCFTSCPNNGLYYKYRYEGAKMTEKITHDKTTKPNEKQGTDRRNFLMAIASATLALPLLSSRKLLAQNNGAGSIPSGTAYPVTPPGSLGYEHFTGKCIACYLCVSVCPSNVIVPSFFDYGLQGFMQPKLDYNKNYCIYDCVRCTEICPTGAITEISEEEKKTTQLGVAKFLYESCTVVVHGTDCGACAEYCPTPALQMIPYNGIFIPEVHPEYCIGCGACEYACPTEPYKAIFVESNRVHDEALPVDEGEGPQEHDEDEFPF